MTKPKCVRSGEWFMRAALALAAEGRGSTYPNPAVGAVVVRGGRIVGRGFHRRWGLPHAEVEAIRDAGRAARGADLYVTLEPCCHHGKTPPCTDAIVRSGIRRVYASMLDPNPLVNGKGLAVLRSAGLDTRTGLLAESAARLNEAYVKFMRTGRPFVTIKVAQTLDGRIAAANGNARWITSASSRQAARGMRGEAQALIVGSRTALRDDPLLLPAPRRRRGYYRCILDTHLALAPTSRLASTARRYPVIAYCARPRGRTSRELAGRRAILEAMGVVVEPVGTGPDGLLDLEEVARDLATRKVMHIWVEGGGAVFTSFLMRHMVDKVITFIAPKIMGGGGSVESVGDLGVRAPDRSHLLAVDGVSCVGDDLVVVAYPNARGRRAAARGRRSAAAGTNRGGKSAKASRGLRWEHV